MVEQTANIGSYTQIWSIGSMRISPALSFVVGQLGSGGTVSTTDIGQTSDGSLIGISTISVTNGTVSTYSATELDATASLYYDAQTVGTLYQDGTAILQGVSPVTANAAGGTMSASATAWDDYDLQTDHYAVAFFVSGAYFENPLYLGDGSCDDASSDCRIGLGGGVYWLEAASIYVGSTLAHQTDVPQDGSTALVSDSAYNSFLSSAPQPVPSGVTFSVDSWAAAIKKIAPILFIARSVWADQNPTNPYIYPLPYLVDLVNDTQTTPSPGNNAERDRTYLLEDTYGHPWGNNNPVTVSEKFLYVGGTQSEMPAPNNPSNPQAAPWTHSTGEMSNGLFTDEYGFTAAGQSPLWFLQFYWAWGFTVPSDFTLPTIPGVNDGSISGMTGLAIPLMIKSKNPATAFQNCAMFGTQGLYFSQQYIAVNGEAEPATPPGCPVELGAF